MAAVLTHDAFTLIHLVETLCLKGLFCSYIDGRKQEAHEWVKKGSITTDCAWR